MLMPAAALGCRASEVEIVATRALGPTAVSDRISGRDGGASVLSFGRSMWLFGDTILSQPDSRGSAWRNNSWSHTTDLTAGDGIDLFVEPVDEWGGPAELFTYTAEELAYNEAHASWNPDCLEPCGARVMMWPMAAVRHKLGDRTLVFYGKYRGEPGEWNFEGIGSSAAVWTDFEYGPVRPILDDGSDEPTLLFHSPEPMFGQALVLVDDEQLYSFGCTDEFYHPCKLARVHVDELFDREAWRFWTGREWSSQLDEAVTVFEGHTILSVHFNRFVNRYLAVYSEPLGTGVYLRSAEALEGPWSDRKLIFEAEPSATGYPPYAALAHPEYAREGGRFEYITYFRSPADWQGEVRLVELELAPMTD